MSTDFRSTDFKSLCAELTDELSGYKMANPMHDWFLLNRARAALAAELAPPADGEVTELVAWLWSMHELAGEHNPEEQCRYARTADLLEHLASPACVVLKPSPELIEAFKAAGPGRIEPMERLAPQPVPEEPTNQEIEEWAAASSVPGESLDPDSGRWERCLSSEEFCATVRAALAFWGQP